jgi:hypothetical protein
MYKLNVANLALLMASLEKLRSSAERLDVTEEDTTKES